MGLGDAQSLRPIGEGLTSTLRTFPTFAAAERTTAFSF